MTSSFVYLFIEYGEMLFMSPMVRRPPGMEIALLGFLIDSPQHGYQLHQMILDPTGLGLIWHLKQSQLYALLNKLEGDGCITSTLQNQDPHPPRRVVELTNLGRKVFMDWVSSPVTLPRLIRQEFLAKLYFARRENKDRVQQLIEKQRSVCTTWIDGFKTQQRASEPKSYQWKLYQYRLGQIEALQHWLDLFE
jgi:DNA-binding PadR family transcriptional regulator